MHADSHGMYTLTVNPKNKKKCEYLSPHKILCLGYKTFFFGVFFFFWRGLFVHPNPRYAAQRMCVRFARVAAIQWTMNEVIPTTLHIRLATKWDENVELYTKDYGSERLGSSWGRAGVELGSGWGRPGVGLGSVCRVDPHPNPHPRTASRTQRGL